MTCSPYCNIRYVPLNRKDASRLRCDYFQENNVSSTLFSLYTVYTRSQRVESVKKRACIRLGNARIWFISTCFEGHQVVYFIFFPCNRGVHAWFSRFLSIFRDLFASGMRKRFWSSHLCRIFCIGEIRGYNILCKTARDLIVPAAFVFFF